MTKAKEPTVKLHTTEPHAAHEVHLVEDDSDPNNRIYIVRETTRNGKNQPFPKISALGSELANLAAWWRREVKRPKGVNIDDPDVDLDACAEPGCDSPLEYRDGSLQMDVGSRTEIHVCGKGHANEKVFVHVDTVRKMEEDE